MPALTAYLQESRVDLQIRVWLENVLVYTIGSGENTALWIR